MTMREKIQPVIRNLVYVVPNSEFPQYILLLEKWISLLENVCRREGISYNHVHLAATCSGLDG